MTHNLHILLGDLAEQNITRIKEYIIKYGDEYVDDKGGSAAEYLQFITFGNDGRIYLAEPAELDTDKFISGIEDSYAVELKPISEAIEGDEAAKRLRWFFKKRFSSTVNLTSHGEDNYFHVCIHLPLYTDNDWEKAKEILSAIDASDENYRVDLMMIAPDLAHITIDDEDVLAEQFEELELCARSNLKQIVEAKLSHTYQTLKSLILIQNRNENGVALDLNRESYAHLIGEYALATAANYNSIYSTNLLGATQKKFPIFGIGLSTLHFDRFYFVQYMLRKAYLHILDREQITQESVDINKVSNIAQRILAANINIFSKIYAEEVRPRIDEKKMSGNDIMAELDPIIKKAIEEVDHQCLAYISDEMLSLPEKRVTLAQLLGEDDVLLDGIQYDCEQLIIDECRNETMDFFIRENNALASMDETAIDEEEKPIRDYAILSSYTGDGVMTATQRIQEIKKLKVRIKTGTDYIRRQEDIVKKLEADIERKEDTKKRLTENGFEFEGQTYRVMPENIVQPLEETYVPIGGRLPAEADLRQFFTRVKDQGQLGSCTAFSVVSVYEYFIKRDQGKEVDLSELFAYQSARRRMPKDRIQVEEGTSIYDVISSMGEDGICLEVDHPYTVENLQEPDDNAINAAKEHKISKALNVECNLDDMKSAISQGYPIIVSLRIFEQLSSSTGFVPRPTETECQNEEEAYHAMVLCGYSDKDKVFIVRNSWGERFGDKGYCYIPYSYITDPNLMKQACIITKISDVEIKVIGQLPKISISFNMKDSAIQAAILKTLIDEERENIKQLELELSALSQNYYMLEANLGRPDTREVILVGTKKRLTWEMDRLEEKKQNVSTERLRNLDVFDEDTVKLWGLCGLIALGVLIVNICITYIDWIDFKDWVWSYLLLGCVSVFIAQIVVNKTYKLIPDSIKDKYNDRVHTVWLLWLVLMIIVVVGYCALAFFDVISNPFPIPLRWIFMATTCYYIPLLYFMLHRNKVKQDISLEYFRLINECAMKIADLKKEREETKLKMHIAGRILDNITNLISHLRERYDSMKSYLDNLKVWRKENLKIQNMQPVNRHPFMSLIDNRCLDEYFAKHSDELTDSTRLYRLFCSENYTVSEAQILLAKKQIKQTLAKELLSKVDDFSIYDHVTGAKSFEYVSREHVEINNLLQTMNSNSKIFVRTSQRMNNEAKCKLLFRAAPGNDGYRDWDNSVQENFQLDDKPTSQNLSSQYKIFIIRLEGLTENEVVLLDASK